jgi:hypothetical protein
LLYFLSICIFFLADVRTCHVFPIFCIHLCLLDKLAQETDHWILYNILPPPVFLPSSMAFMINMFFHQSFLSFLCLFVFCLSICLYFCFLSDCLAACLYFCLYCLSVFCLTTCLGVCLNKLLSLYRSICLYVCLCV